MKKLLLSFFFIFLLFFESVTAQVRRSVQTHTNFFSAQRNPGFFLDMAYDDSGFLWTGSYVLRNESKENAGLMRFDGNNFQHIALPDFGNANHSVIAIQKTGSGDFYLVTWGKDYQLLKFDPFTLAFDLIDFPGYDQQLFHISRTFAYEAKYYSIVQNDGKTTLFALKGTKAHKITEISLPQGAEINKFTSFVPYEDYFVLIANGAGVALYNWEGKKQRTIYETGDNRRFGLSFFKDKGYFLMGKQPVLYTFSPRLNKVVPAFDFREEVGFKSFWFWNDAKGRLLLSIREANDLSVQEVTDNGLESIGVLEEVPIIKWPMFYAKDARESIWVGNQADQLSHYQFPNEKIAHFLADKPIGLWYQLNEDEFLVSTKNTGWYVVNLEKGTTKPFQLKYKTKPFPIADSRAIIPGNSPRYVWSNSLNGMVRVDVKTHQVKYWQDRPVEALARLNDSLLVYGTYTHDLMVFNTKTKQHQVLLPEKHWVKDLFVRGDIIYAATSAGLLIYDTKTRNHGYYAPDKTGVNRTINTLLYQAGKGLFLGSRSGKVYQFDLKTKAFNLFYEVPNKAEIASLFFYGKVLWINTQDGFFTWDSRTAKSERYSTVDGFSSDYATRSSALLTKKGALIGTVQGLNFMVPSTLQPFRDFGTIVPLSLQFYNDEIEAVQKIQNREKIKALKKIVLPANNRYFQLNFGIANDLHFVNIQLKYRLNNKAWVPLNNGNSLRLENLAPGEYQLEVAAFDRYGDQIGESIAYTLVAEDFFYKRWWFSFGMLLLLIVLIGWLLFSIQQDREIKLKQIAVDHLNKSNHVLEERLKLKVQLSEEREQALSAKERELIANALRMANFKNSVETTLKGSPKEISVPQLKKKLKQILQQENGGWDYFMKRFVEVHPDFIAKIKKQHPELTQNDLDCCALIKLNLSNKEIAMILNISHASVITKKYRLRKKLDLSDEEVSLEELVVSY